MKSIYILVAMLFLYGCSSDTENTTSTVETSVAFEVSQSPSLAGGYLVPVPVNVRIVVYATQELDLTTVNDTTVFIRKITGTDPAIEVGAFHTPQGDALIITPTLFMAPNSEYEIVVTTAVATVSGEHRTTDAVISFTTNAQVDTTPPTMESVLPENASNTVESFTTISFQFNEALSPETISNVGITLQEQGPTTAPAIGGELVLSGSLLTFIPEQNLTAGAPYQVTLDTTQLMDLAGNSYAGASPKVVDFNVTATGTNVINFVASTDLDLNVKVNAQKSIGSQLFCATEKGIRILDYDNAALPGTQLSLLGSLDSPDLGAVYALEVDPAASTLYVASSTGMSIIDYTNPTSMQIIGHVDVLNSYGHFTPVYGITVDGTHAYLAATSLGVIDVDISDPAAPSILATQGTQALAFDLFVIDSTNLMLSSFGNGISKIDRATMAETDLITDVMVFTHNAFNAVGVYNNFYFAAGNLGLGRYDEDMSAPVTLSFSDLASYLTRTVSRNYWSAGIVKDIGLVFYSSSNDIHDYQFLPFKPSMIGYLDDPTPAGDDVLIISDLQGQLYVQVMPGV